MTKFLSTDEILELMEGTNHPRFEHHKQNIEAAVNLAAIDAAANLGITAGEGNFEGMVFGGLCVPFRPAIEGQEMPDELVPFDVHGEWE